MTGNDNDGKLLAEKLKAALKDHSKIENIKDSFSAISTNRHGNRLDYPENIKKLREAIPFLSKAELDILGNTNGKSDALSNALKTSCGDKALELIMVALNNTKEIEKNLEAIKYFSTDAVKNKDGIATMVAAVNKTLTNEDEACANKEGYKKQLEMLINPLKEVPAATQDAAPKWGDDDRKAFAEFTGAVEAFNAALGGFQDNASKPAEGTDLSELCKEITSRYKEKSDTIDTTNLEKDRKIIENISTLSTKIGTSYINSTNALEKALRQASSDISTLYLSDVSDAIQKRIPKQSKVVDSQKNPNDLLSQNITAGQDIKPNESSPASPPTSYYSQEFYASKTKEVGEFSRSPSDKMPSATNKPKRRQSLQGETYERVATATTPFDPSYTEEERKRVEANAVETRKGERDQLNTAYTPENIKVRPGIVAQSKEMLDNLNNNGHPAQDKSSFAKIWPEGITPNTSENAAQPETSEGPAFMTSYPTPDPTDIHEGTTDAVKSPQDIQYDTNFPQLGSDPEAATTHNPNHSKKTPPKEPQKSKKKQKAQDYSYQAVAEWIMNGREGDTTVTLKPTGRDSIVDALGHLDTAIAGQNTESTELTGDQKGRLFGAIAGCVSSNKLENKDFKITEKGLQIDGQELTNPSETEASAYRKYIYEAVLKARGLTPEGIAKLVEEAPGIIEKYNVRAAGSSATGTYKTATEESPTTATPESDGNNVIATTFVQGVVDSAIDNVIMRPAPGATTPTTTAEATTTAHTNTPPATGPVPTPTTPTVTEPVPASTSTSAAGGLDATPPAPEAPTTAHTNTPVPGAVTGGLATSTSTSTTPTPAEATPPATGDGSKPKPAHDGTGTTPTTPTVTEPVLTSTPAAAPAGGLATSTIPTPVATTSAEVDKNNPKDTLIKKLLNFFSLRSSLPKKSHTEQIPAPDIEQGEKNVPAPATGPVPTPTPTTPTVTEPVHTSTPGAATSATGDGSKPKPAHDGAPAVANNQAALQNQSTQRPAKEQEDPKLRMVKYVAAVMIGALLFGGFGMLLAAIFILSSEIQIRKNTSHNQNQQLQTQQNDPLIKDLSKSNAQLMKQNLTLMEKNSTLTEKNSALTADIKKSMEGLNEVFNNITLQNGASSESTTSSYTQKLDNEESKGKSKGAARS